jgi:3-oxoacyl-[acyl-carrier protein] reductase
VASTELGNEIDKPLAGQTAAVTGSSSGIGRAIALELAAAGANIVVHCRQNRTGAKLAADAIRTLGCEALVLVADLSSPAEQDRLVDDCWCWRPIDVWVNNAGADVLTGDAAQWSFEAKLAMLWQVDVVATLRLSRAVGRRMQQRGRGTIINIGWDRVECGMAGDSGEMFAAVKGAIMAATRSLAKSLAPAVRVNCVSPGWIRTAWGEKASPEWQERARRESLHGRWGEPADVARVVRFLASPAAQFVNGQIINVNGGRAY